mgnify:CR=1
MKKPHCGCCAAADRNKYKARAEPAIAVRRGPFGRLSGLVVEFLPE